MTDAQKRVVFCNDRYLEILRAVALGYSPHMTGPDCWRCAASAACWISTPTISIAAPAPRRPRHELPDGRSIVVKYWGCERRLGGDA